MGLDNWTVRKLALDCFYTYCNFSHKVQPTQGENEACTLEFDERELKIISDGATCKCCKFGHQVASHCPGLPYRHYKYVLSWYLHQPE